MFEVREEANRPAGEQFMPMVNGMSRINEKNDASKIPNWAALNLIQKVSKWKIINLN